MNTLKRIKKNAKALSPIFAVLILIAIAVIAGIVVYMFTSGYLSTMMGGGTAAQEKVAVQGVAVGTTELTVYVQNIGPTSVTITAGLVKDVGGNVVESVDISDMDVAAGAYAAVTLTLTGSLTSGSYTVTIVTSKGGSFVSPSFVVP